MKQLNFIVVGQELKRTDTQKIVSDAIGQFEALFTFDEWWGGYTPTAQFTKDGKTIDCILEDNKCIVPPEALQGGGVFYVNVFSTDGTGDRKTANEVAVPLKTSGYKADGSHSVKPTPTIYEQLLKKIDESTVINGDGVVASPNADFAEVAEWSDGNPDGEDRIGYFVCFDVPTSGIIMRKANADDDVKGITVSNPSFAGNCTKDKFDENGKLLPQYEYVGVIGLVPVHDNGNCVVGERCIPADGGIAAPSPNDKGYQVVERYNENMILVAIEPNGDMVCRLQEQIDKLKNSSGVKYIREFVEAHQLEEGIYVIDEVNGGCVLFENDKFSEAFNFYELYNGLIIVSNDNGLTAKQMVVFSRDNTFYTPKMFITYIAEDGTFFDENTEVFMPKSYIDGQIASLQAQICEEKLYTFSFGELDEDILSKSIETGLRFGVPYIKLVFSLCTATKNADGTFTPYFDLPIEYMANPTLSGDSTVSNFDDFKSFAIKSPLLSNGFVAYDKMKNALLYKGQAKDMETRIVSFTGNGKVGLCATWYLYYGDEDSRNRYFDQLFKPLFDSLTDFALQYENHKISTVKPKKLV